MRRFIHRLLVLALVFAMTLGAFNYLIGWKLVGKIHYGHLNEVKYVVVGHSHPECAFNDSLIDGMKNFALSGEAYFYNYYKMKSMLLKGMKLNNVFIEYSNNSLSSDLCEWIWDNQNLARSYVKFSPYISTSDNALIFLHNPRGWINSYGLSMKWRMDQLFKNVNYLDYSGGYKCIVRNHLDSLIRADLNSIDTTIRNAPMEVCEWNQFYLREMIQLLKHYDAKVYLIRSPLHRFYPGYKFEAAYDSIYRHFFSDVERLDFSKFPLNDEDFVDFEHLNHKGAGEFSKAFHEMISNGLLTASDKQQFIDYYITERR